MGMDNRGSLFMARSLADEWGIRALPVLTDSGGWIFAHKAQRIHRLFTT